MIVLATFHRHGASFGYSMIIHKQTLDMETTWLLSPQYHPDWNDTLTKNTVRTNGLSSSLTMIGLGFRSEIASSTTTSHDGSKETTWLNKYNSPLSRLGHYGYQP